MATRTRRRAPSKRRRPQPARRRPPARGRKPASRRGAGGRPRGKKKGPNPVLEAARWGAVHVKTAPPEAWGGLIAFVAVIAGLGVYSHGAGPVGNAIRYLGTLMIGRLVILLPVLLLIAGAALLIPRVRSHGMRILIGSSVVVFALSMMVHLARLNRPLSAPLGRLQRAGGIFGALMARPTSDLIGLWATWIVAALLF
ncbi:MAG: hypothetical protein ACRDKT_08910, partial [Actinomycetota bacterium]